MGKESPPLYNLTSELIWPAVVARTRSHPDELFWCDNNGGTALHHACRFRSVDVVREMLKTRHMAACIQDKVGSTPLHIACWSGSAEIIRLLVDAHRTAASTPPTDKRGRTPLHVACSSYPPPSVDTIQVLLKANPDALSISDGCGHTPLSLLCERHETRMKTALDRIDQGLARDDVYSGVLRPFWRQLCALLEANVGGIFNTNAEWKLLHALTVIPDCPRVLFQLALKLQPEQIKEPLYGNLPLHFAVECRTSQDNEEYRIYELLALFPRAAQMPNREGRLPLHVALESGKSWDAVVRKIFQAFPSAITMQDRKSFLYPFMIAALPKSDQHHLDQLEIPGNDVTEDTCLHLTTAYETLQADPSLAASRQ